MRNRLLGLFLVFAMLLSLQPLISRAAENTEKLLNERELIAEQTITSIGIMKPAADGGMNYTKKVSRADFAQMLIQASSYSGKVSKKSDVSLFKDVTKKHSKSGYIKFVVKQGWMSGYLNGTFKPGQGVTLDEAINGVVQLLGYSNSDFSGILATARYDFYLEKELNNNISRKRKSALTRRDCMNLFYNVLTVKNKEGTVYGTTLGYSLDEQGEIDYLKIIEKSLKGPIIAGSNWESLIPFDVKTATVYKNNKKSSETKILEYDVIYYSKTTNGIWVYDDRIEGKLEAVSPNRTAPTEITVTGESYVLGNQKTATKVSAQGEYKSGMNLILLLGRDGKVVDIITPEKIEAVLYGCVIETGEHLSTNQQGYDMIKSYAKIVDTKGTIHEIDCDTSFLFTGNPVQISYIGGETVLTKLTEQPLYGTVNSDGTKITDTYLAANVRIIDVNGKAYTKVYPAQIADLSLTNQNVIYYAKNKLGEITDLILKNATGETYEYGILLSSDVIETEIPMPEIGIIIRRSGTYKYDLNGKEYIYSTDHAIWDYSQPLPIGFLFEGNEIKEMLRLLRVPIASIDGRQVRAGDTVYEISDKAVIYLEKNDKYYLTKLSNVSNLNAYTIDGYIEKNPQLGGKIRVLVARSK